MNAVEEESRKRQGERPKIKVKINETEVEALMDSGASISVISEKTLFRLWRHWDLFRLPMPAHLRVTGITGHKIQVVDYVQVEMEVMGKVIRRPILVVSGLDHTELVLGWDTMREEGIVLDAKENKVFFKKKTEEKAEDWTKAELALIRRTTIPPRTVQKISVFPMTGDRVIEAGEAGLCSAIPGSVLTLWDALAEVDRQNEVTIAVLNNNEEPLNLQAGDVIGTFHKPAFYGEEITPLTEEFIESMFGDIGKEPKEPTAGKTKDIKEDDKKELIAKFKIEATGEWRQKYIDLLLRYHDTISRSKFDLGWTDVIQHKINMQHEIPIHSRQFRVPYEHEAMLKEYVEELLRKGAIEPSRSPYNSPIFCVAKKPLPGAKPGDPLPMRVVLDYRRINEASIPDRYCMREIRECLDQVGRSGSRIFTTVDLTSGFWQQALAEESRQMTAFTLPGFGPRYQWKVTPMGLQGSPASFARLMDFVMQGLKNCITYIDDVLVHSRDHERHLQHLEQTLLRLRKYGMKLNIEKTIVGATSVQYLGYTLRGGGISPSKDKLAVIKEFQTPSSPKQIREFIGVCNYFRCLIKDFARVAAPLMKMTRLSSTWKGGPLPEEAQESFDLLKKALTSDPVVALPQTDKQYILQTDGAQGDSVYPGGLGAVLLQEDEEGTERVIAYASRSLRKHEKNYSAFLLELTAAVYGIEEFENYLRGRRFVLCTDHKPMEKLSTVHKRTLNRLQQMMLEFDFELRYKKGSENAVADFLSRNAVVEAIEAVTDDEQSVAQAQREDQQVRMLRTYLKDKTLPREKATAAWVMRMTKDCILEDELVWYVSRRPGRREKVLLFAPEKVRDRIMQAAHVTREAGHGGIQRTAERVMMAYYWPGIHQAAEEFIKRCPRCQMSKSVRAPPADLIPLPICEGPNERIHMDLLGTLKASAGGKKYILVITDAFTKYTELASICQKTADEVATALFERWIIRHAVPLMLVTDQGKEFCNQVVEEVCKLWGTDKRRTSPFHPETNAQAETYNRTIVKYMRAMLDNNRTTEWEELLPCLQLAYNCHVHRAIKETPFFLTYHHDPRLPYFDIQRPNVSYKDTMPSETFRRAQEAFRLAKTNMEEAERARVEYFNKMTKERSFRAGDRVLVHFPNITPGANPKFFKTWRLFTVVKTVGKVNLMVRSTTREKAHIVHVNRVKHATELDIEEACDSTLVAYEGYEVGVPRSQEAEWRKQRAERERIRSRNLREEGDWGPYTYSQTAAQHIPRQMNEEREEQQESEQSDEEEQSFESVGDNDQGVEDEDDIDQYKDAIDDLPPGPQATRRRQQELPPEQRADPWYALATWLIPTRAQREAPGPAPQRTPPRTEGESPPQAAATRPTRSNTKAQDQDATNKVFVPRNPPEYKKRGKKGQK